MKKVILGVTAVLSFSSSVYAQEVIIPQNSISLYVGSFSNMEAELKEKIFEAATEKCGELDNAHIGRTEINLTLRNVFKYPIQGRVEAIDGSYPQVSAVTDISCYK
ncbi:hypothetical protein M902_1091 [Bacteriovorax sp. BAL6_X]|uniref:hypothetical protein n=1 Tax=Bacteriovorax sp. BAL6_X TaxID=1201290 RepID=UPI000386E3D7|nr:hypothetical protein [Bacteriovorax sp. BAL6_X]EPZ49830.1 hypothetical protein M902_1091 [Bacteriovorax sp. BAL6_X]